jgi:hypothetical protein
MADPLMPPARGTPPLDPRQSSRCMIVGVDQPTFDVLGFLDEHGHPPVSQP